MMTGLFTVEVVVPALLHMLIYIAALEFICSQSPHSMKGLLIGLFYAIKGLYQVIAALLLLPFSLVSIPAPLNCVFYYYLVNKNYSDWSGCSAGVCVGG